MSSPPPPPDAGDPASQPIFTDEILGEIFLRLDTAADLARASAACTAFLRVVRFLRRNRSLYRQPVIGFLECAGRTPFHTLSFYHAQPPHRSASSARALAEAADFTCSFVPDPGSWLLHDATGGRLLLCSDSSDNTTDFKDLVVCDPLQRRYVQIPSVPVDLTAGTFTSGAYYHFPSFFAPTGEEEGSSFRVILMIYDYDKMKVTAFVFSSATSQWRRVTFDGWKMNGYITFVLTSCCYHPHISVHKTSRLFSEVLMLDTHKTEFSLVRTPVLRFRQHAIIEAGEGRLGFLTIGDGMLDLYCKAWQDNGVSAEEWQHEKTIPIPLPDSDRYSISFCGTGDGYLLIQAIPTDSAELEHMPEMHYFTLHLKTLMVERLCMLNKRVYFAHLYANFLPPLSLPSV
ncbi:uncharacterized protein [Miscanthus floridulus]|uniref:uncharacterized protein isoform X1 n=1 Tax=Miscanthus floridulus TaxID=154761 RepID=UPI003459124D